MLRFSHPPAQASGETEVPSVFPSEYTHEHLPKDIERKGGRVSNEQGTKDSFPVTRGMNTAVLLGCKILVCSPHLHFCLLAPASSQT